jgi:hypothetical protein
VAKVIGPVGIREPALRKSAFIVAIVTLCALYSSAQEARPTESQVEAVYLYNFGKFVTWPDRASQRELFGICILGKDPFGEVLDATVNGESVGGKQTKVQRLSNVEEAGSCSILFISAAEEKRLPTILAVAQRMNTLTVSDIPDFAERGGIIGLVKQKDRVRFEVNRKAAEQSHLVLSSELLKVALRVVGK